MCAMKVCKTQHGLSLLAYAMSEVSPTNDYIIYYLELPTQSEQRWIGYLKTLCVLKWVFISQVIHLTC